MPCEGIFLHCLVDITGSGQPYAHAEAIVILKRLLAYEQIDFELSCSSSIANRRFSDIYFFVFKMLSKEKQSLAFTLM